jgi:hypothetical protein
MERGLTQIQTNRPIRIGYSITFSLAHFSGGHYTRISFLAGYCIVRLSHRRSPSSVLVSVGCLGLMLTLSSWDLVRYFHNRSEMQNE